MSDVTKTPKKRGRKKLSEGGKPAPRKIWCSCSAIVDNELVVEDFLCKGDKDTLDKDVLAQAVTAFETKHGVEPVVKGPFFKRNPVVEAKKSRDRVNISMEDIVFDRTKPHQTAVYKSWNVTVRFIENRDDAAYIIYKSHVNEDKKTKPQSKVVFLNSLENIQAAED